MATLNKMIYVIYTIPNRNFKLLNKITITRTKPKVEIFDQVLFCWTSVTET